MTWLKHFKEYHDRFLCSWREKFKTKKKVSLEQLYNADKSRLLRHALPKQNLVSSNKKKHISVYV